MRKTYRNKKSSCGICKPHKKGWQSKWEEREYIHLKEWDTEKKDIMQRIMV